MDLRDMPVDEYVKRQLTIRRPECFCAPQDEVDWQAWLMSSSVTCAVRCLFVEFY